MPPTITNVSLSWDELRTAFRMAGLEAGPASPLAMRPPPAVGIDSAALGALRAQGIVRGSSEVPEPWLSVLRSLATPSAALRLYLGSSDSFVETRYYSGPALAACAEKEGRYSITFPVDHGEIGDMLGDWLRWNDAPSMPSFRAVLQPDELTALLCLADVWREESLRAVLERRAPVLDRMHPDQLNYELQMAAAAADPRWCTGLMTLHAPNGWKPAAALVSSGLQGLVGKAWIRFDGDTIVPEPGLANLAQGLAGLIPHAVFEPLSGGLTLVTRGAASLWVFEFTLAQCVLNGLGGPLAAGYVRAQLRTWLNAPEPQPLPVAAPAPAPAPGVCVQCGKPLKPGRPFCVSCGTPVGA